MPLYHVQFSGRTRVEGARGKESGGGKTEVISLACMRRGESILRTRQDWGRGGPSGKTGVSNPSLAFLLIFPAFRVLCNTEVRAFRGGRCKRGICCGAVGRGQSSIIARIARKHIDQRRDCCRTIASLQRYPAARRIHRIFICSAEEGMHATS